MSAVEPNVRVTVDVKAQLLAHVEQLEAARNYAYPCGYMDDHKTHAALHQVKGVTATLRALINSITITST